MIKLTADSRQQTADSRQRGVAIIIAVAIVVAVTMLTVAMLGVVRRSQSTARVYKINDVLHIALKSAKNQALNYISDASLFGATFHGFTDTAFIYDLDARTGDLAARTYDGNQFADLFKPEDDTFYEPSPAVDLDRSLSYTDSRRRARYELRSRSFVVPLDAAFLIDYVKKDGDGNYPFPGLFDGEQALARNIVPLFTDVFMAKAKDTITITVPKTVTTPATTYYKAKIHYAYMERFGDAGGGKAKFKTGNSGIASINNSSGNQELLITVPANWSDITGKDITFAQYSFNDQGNNCNNSCDGHKSKAEITNLFTAWLAEVVAAANAVNASGPNFTTAGIDTGSPGSWSVEFINDVNIGPTIVNYGGITLLRSGSAALVHDVIKNADGTPFETEEISEKPAEANIDISRIANWIKQATADSGNFYIGNNGYGYCDDSAGALKKAGETCGTSSAGKIVNLKSSSGGFVLQSGNQVQSVTSSHSLQTGEKWIYLRVDADKVAASGQTAKDLVQTAATKNGYTFVDFGTTNFAFSENTTPLTPNEIIDVSTSGGGAVAWKPFTGILGMTELRNGGTKLVGANGGQDPGASGGISATTTAASIASAGGIRNTPWFFANVKTAVNLAANDLDTAADKYRAMFNSGADAATAVFLSRDDWEKTPANTRTFYTMTSAANAYDTTTSPLTKAEMLNHIASNKVITKTYQNDGTLATAERAAGVSDISAPLPSPSSGYTVSGDTVNFKNLADKGSAALGPVAVWLQLSEVIETLEKTTTVDEEITLQVGDSGSQLDDFFRLSPLQNDDTYFKKAIDYIVLNGGGTYVANTLRKLKSLEDFHLDDSGFTAATSTGSKDDLINSPYAAVYQPFLKISDLIAAATQAEMLYRIDKARLLANSNAVNAGYGAPRQLAADDLDQTPELKNLPLPTSFVKPDVLKRPSGYETFTELGISAAALNAAARQYQTDSGAPHAWGSGSTKLLPASIPYNTLIYADPALRVYDLNNAIESWSSAAPIPGAAENLRIGKIPLTANTPRWLIAAGIGWQLFNSPTAKLRRLTLGNAVDEGGAIYRIDYTASEILTMIFDHRRFYKNAVEPGASGDLVITPFGFNQSLNGVTVAAVAGEGNYSTFPLQYRGEINANCAGSGGAAADADAINASPKSVVNWKGWDSTTSLDLLAFAPNTTNSYIADGDSPFTELAVNDTQTTFRDIRTKTYTGTGVYVKPALAPDSNYGDAADENLNGRLAIYGTTLRAHGELAKIIDIVELYKSSGEGAIDNIINAVLSPSCIAPNDDSVSEDLRGKNLTVGYDPTAVLERSTLSRNPYEGVIMYGKIGGNLTAIGGTRTPATLNYKLDGSNYKPDNANPPVGQPYTVLQDSVSLAAMHNFNAAIADYFRFGGGATGDRFSETYISGSGNNSGNDEYQKYVVDNVARDWDGTIMGIPGKIPASSAVIPPFPKNPTFGFSARITYPNESKFADWYFRTHPGVYGNDYADSSINANNGGSNVQGFDGTTNGRYAESVWYRTNDAYAPLSANAGSDSNGNFLSGPIIYCDGGNYTTGNPQALTPPPYQHSTGRWDLRGNVGSKAADAPQYTIVTDSLKKSADAKNPAINGSLFRDDTAKTTSKWRWNWGKWEQITNATGDSGGKNNYYTFVSDNTEPGRRLVLKPQSATYGKTGSDTLSGSDNVGAMTGASGAVPGVPNAADYRYASRKAYLYCKIGNDTDSGKNPQKFIKGAYFYGPETDANSTAIKAGNARRVQVDENGRAILDANDYPLIADAVNGNNDGYVGRFVMRPAYRHRWHPAVGTLYPMYTEINPQAIKNAAIERVLVNLFGVAAVDKAQGTTNGASIKYLLPDNFMKVEELRRTHDDANPLFTPFLNDQFYRIITAAAVIDKRKSTVVSYRVAQTVYRQNADNRGGAVVDQHFLDLE